MPFTFSSSAPSVVRPSAKSTLHIARRNAASVPGRIGTHSSAWSAVPVRRGSMTTTLPPRADAVELTEDVGTREQRTTRRLRIATHADQVVGALDVGRRDLPHVPVHEDARDVLGPLVDRARRVDVRHPRLPDEQRHVATEREAVADGVADERGRRGDAVAVEHAVDQVLAAVERFVPRHLAPRVAVAHHRLTQTVGIVVQVTQGRALRAQVTLRPHVVAIPTDQRDVIALHVDLQPAHALTERTRDEMSLHRSSISRLKVVVPPADALHARALVHGLGSGTAPPPIWWRFGILPRRPSTLPE